MRLSFACVALAAQISGCVYAQSKAGAPYGLDVTDYLSSARTRAELQVRRKPALEHLLRESNPESEDFLEQVDELGFTPEGFEDLSWTIRLYESVHAKLRAAKAGPIAEAKLLQQYAGRVGMQQQPVRAVHLLSEAVELVQDTDEATVTLRSELLKDLSEKLDSIGDIEGAAAALIEAAGLQSEPTEKTHTLWTLADWYRRHGRPTDAAAAIHRLTDYLESKPAPPREALMEGWQRIVDFYTDSLAPREAVAAQRQVIARDMQDGAPFSQLLQSIDKLYELGKGLSEESLNEIAKEALAMAAKPGGESGRISLMFEIAGSDVVAGRVAMAEAHLEQARKSVALASRASRSEKAEWKARSEEISLSVERVKRGETVRSTMPMMGILDANGDRIAPSDIPADDPVQMLKRAMNPSDPKSAAEALETIKRVEEKLSPEQRAILEPLLTRIKTDAEKESGVKAGPQDLQTRILHADAINGELDDDTVNTLRDAVKNGRGAWAEQFLIGRLERELHGHAHPFTMSEDLQELLAAFEHRAAWDDGRKWLAWWRNTIGEIDHPESSRLLEHYWLEEQWERKANNPARVAEINREHIAFAARILGENSTEVARLRNPTKDQ
jgi:hypothetical protein